MTDNEQAFQQCDACGATIYPEHIARQVAEHWEGKLLCVHCLREKRANTEPEPTVSLAPDQAVAAQASTQIRAFGSHGGIGFQTGPKATTFRRSLLGGSPNATRCRIFHCKLSDASMRHLEEQINEWIDEQDEVEIKFCNTTIGVVEGKQQDPHLIVTLFY